MILDLLVRVLQARMEEAVANTDGACLAPTIFFSTTGPSMTEWVSSSTDIWGEAKKTLRDKDVLDKLRSVDGVILSMHVDKSCLDNKDVLFDRLLPFITSKAKIENIAWAGSAWYMDVKNGKTDGMDDLPEQGLTERMIERHGFSYLVEHATECLLLMVADRETYQCWQANVNRDNDGDIVSMDDWEMHDRIGFAMEGFTEAAQKALRG